jgi:hypothetical protein
MYAAEFDAFKQTLTDLCVAVNRPVNDDLVRVFWDDLRTCPLNQVQEHAGKLRREGKTRFTSADLRPTVRAANTYEPPRQDMDHFDRFANIQFFKFLRTHDVTNTQLASLLKRKSEIVAAARHDPTMQLGGNAEEQGAELHGILFAAWERVITQ